MNVYTRAARCYNNVAVTTKLKSKIPVLVCTLAVTLGFSLFYAAPSLAVTWVTLGAGATSLNCTQASCGQSGVVINSVKGYTQTAPQRNINWGVFREGQATPQAGVRRFCNFAGPRDPCPNSYLNSWEGTLGAHSTGGNSLAWYNDAGSTTNFGNAPRNSGRSVATCADAKQQGGIHTHRAGAGLPDCDQKYKLVAWNVRVWQMDVAGNATPSPAPVFERVISSDHAADWWNNPNRYTNGGNSGTQGAVYYPAYTNNEGQCPGNASNQGCQHTFGGSDIKNNTRNETIKVILRGTPQIRGSHAGINLVIQQPGNSDDVMYVAQVVGMDDRGTILSQDVSVGFNTPSGGGGGGGSTNCAATGESELTAESSTTAETMVLNQTRGAGTASSWTNSTIPCSASIPRNSSMTFSRALYDPNNNGPDSILKDHSFGTPYPLGNTSLASTGGDKSANIYSLFAIPGVGNDMNQMFPTYTNAIANASNLYNNVSETVRSSTPTAPKSAFGGAPEYGLINPDPYYERFNAKLRYDTRRVVGTQSNSPPGHTKTCLTLNCSSPDPAYYKVPAGASQSIVPLTAYHLQDKTGYAVFKLLAQGPAGNPGQAGNFRGNVGLTSLTKRDDFPNALSNSLYVGSTQYQRTKAPSSPDAYFCVPPAIVQTYNYIQYERDYYPRLVVWQTERKKKGTNTWSRYGLGTRAYDQTHPAVPGTPVSGTNYNSAIFKESGKDVVYYIRNSSPYVKVDTNSSNSTYGSPNSWNNGSPRATTPQQSPPGNYNSHDWLIVTRTDRQHLVNSNPIPLPKYRKLANGKIGILKHYSGTDKKLNYYYGPYNSWTNKIDNAYTEITGNNNIKDTVLNPDRDADNNPTNVPTSTYLAGLGNTSRDLHVPSSVVVDSVRPGYFSDPSFNPPPPWSATGRVGYDGSPKAVGTTYDNWHKNHCPDDLSSNEGAWIGLDLPKGEWFITAFYAAGSPAAPAFNFSPPAPPTADILWGWEVQYDPLSLLVNATHEADAGTYYLNVYSPRVSG